MFCIAQESVLSSTVSAFRAIVALDQPARRLRSLLTAVAAALLVTSAAATVVHAQPVAVNDTEQVDYESSIDIVVLLNDSEGEEPTDPTTVAVVTQPTNGTVSVDADSGEITYWADDRFTGNDSFQYTVDDESGATSNTATVTVTVDAPAPPDIVSFAATPQGADVWEFAGIVDHIYAEDLTIDFGGLLEGHSVAVEADGTFSYIRLMTNGGLVSATTTDEFGQESNEVADVVY